MRSILILFVTILATANLQAQTLKKYAVGKSGCSAYFLCDPGTFALDKSPDSSEVYTSECASNDVNYGIICVKLKDKIPDLQQSEDVLVSYLDYLKTSFSITEATGYGKGHKLKSRENTRGILDYWKDKDNNWKIKGWTDGAYLAVMFAYTKGELPESRVNSFLDGLVLP